MLSYNVAALLRSAPGTSERFAVTLARLRIADDLEVARPVQGEIRLWRTGRSILVRGHVDTALVESCSRCLGPALAPVSVDIDEEALPSVDIDTGLPVDASQEPGALRLDDHHELDLTPTLRDAISLAEPIAPLCRPDCLGLCPTCGLDRNSQPGHAHADDDVDPRLAGLIDLRERLS